MTENERLRRLLARIAAAAGKASKEARFRDDDDDEGPPGVDTPGCSVKALPKRLRVKAAQNAMRINPVNAPLAAQARGGTDLGVLSPLQIAVLTAKYWGPKPRTLSVSFLDSTPANVRARVVEHLNAWAKRGCVSFAETRGTGHVRISMEETGHWSYLGTDITLIPTNQATMNLQGFTMRTSESEYRRVVRHEAGHTLGFPHEHMRKALVARIDPKKAYPYFLENQGWDKAMVDAQVLTPLSKASIMGTPEDQTSIMCYQLPGEITKDGKPILGGADINATDHQFVARIYPKPGAARRAARFTADDLDDESFEDDELDDGLDDESGDDDGLWPEVDDVNGEE